MTAIEIGFVAEQRHLFRPGKRCQQVDGFALLAQMMEVQARIAIPIVVFPVLVANRPGAAQLAEMTVLDAGLVQGLGQRRLGESRLSGDR